MIARPSPGPTTVAGTGFLERGGAGVVEIDSWLVERAASAAAAGRPVHVRVTAASLRTGMFATRISKAVHRAGANPGHVTVEIDEAFAAQETDEVSRFARLVLSTGVRIAINGVALRYPHRDHLARIPAHALKIDPWLAGDVACEGRSATLVDEIVSLAKRHEMTTIAEGVDDEELMGMLRARGVDWAQGFYRQRRA